MLTCSRSDRYFSKTNLEPGKRRRELISCNSDKDGSQTNESAIEQLKDDQIANAIRHSFKSVTGNELQKGK